MLSSKVVEIAKSQIGYRETGTNITKYAKDLDDPMYFCTKKQGLSWCCVFVCWCVVQACDGSYTQAHKYLYQPASKDNLAAVCGYAADYFKKKKAWHTSPKVGDQVFFKDDTGTYTHTGVVVGVSNGTIVTVEGNKNNMVQQCQYAVSNKRIAGYGRPIYEEGGYNVTVRTLKYVKGNTMKGQDVTSVQAIVGAKQDGSYGPKTKEAVTYWQEAHGLVGDGVVGPKTYGKMFAH